MQKATLVVPCCGGWLCFTIYKQRAKRAARSAVNEVSVTHFRVRYGAARRSISASRVPEACGCSKINSAAN